MDKTILRREHGKTAPYALLSRESIQNPNLSWKSKGLLAYLLSLPDQWQIYIKELPRHCKDGEKATRAAFNELLCAGHITRGKLRGSKGHFQGYEYVVHEAPVPEIERTPVKAKSPYAGKRHAVNGALDNTHLIADTIPDTPVRDKGLTRYDWDQYYRRDIDKLETEHKH